MNMIFLDCLLVDTDSITTAYTKKLTVFCRLLRCHEAAISAFESWHHCVHTITPLPMWGFNCTNLANSIT